MARNGTEQVRQLQRALYRTAKQSKAVKFYSLYDKVWRLDVLWEAWKQVKENRGAQGVDGETIEGIVSRGEEGLMLSRLQEQLRAKTYRFQPVRRVDIPKPKGGTRPLGIATVEDRAVIDHGEMRRWPARRFATICIEERGAWWRLIFAAILRPFRTTS